MEKQATVTVKILSFYILHIDDDLSTSLPRYPFKWTLNYPHIHLILSFNRRYPEVFDPAGLNPMCTHDLTTHVH